MKQEFNKWLKYSLKLLIILFIYINFKTEDEVRKLAAYLMQVNKADPFLHHEIYELIMVVDEQALANFSDWPLKLKLFKVIIKITH